jgi:hypothetical protein
MKVRKIVLLSLAGGLLGCQDQDPPTSPTLVNRSSSVSTAAAPRSSNSHGDEQIFVDMAKDAPSFAGFYIDASDRIVVLVADDADRGRARSSLMAHATSRRSGAPRRLAQRMAKGDFEVRNVEYSFRQLAAWRDLVSESVLSMDGVIYDDMDEVRNRVTIGVSRKNAGVEAAVIAQLKKLGIPLEAVYIEGAEPIVPRVAARTSVSAASLMGAGESTRGAYSTFGGGYLLYPKGCTATFVGDFGGTPVVATASHCSASRYALDGGPVESWIGTTIGTETADPSPTSNLCTLGFNCSPARGSDAALYALNGIMPGVRGGIAHLSVRSSALPPVTSFIVNSSQPWFYITATSTWHPVGWIVDKVGVTTGWTYGNITASCVDMRENDGFAIRCANKVHMWSAGGDSGSPVFALDDPSDPSNISVSLMGTLSGARDTTFYNGQAAGVETYYTSYRAIDDEVGTRNGLHLNPFTVNVRDFIYLDGYVSSGDAVLSWNAVSAPELSTPTEYRIYMWMTWRQYDQEGYPYSYIGERSLVGTTTSTSFTHAGTGYSSTSCEETDYNSVEHYQIIAWNQGLQSAGNDICFQQ